MTDISRVLTVVALVLLFIVTMQMNPGGIFGGVHLPTGVWIGLGVAFYFGVLKRGSGCCFRTCSPQTR